MSSVRFAAGVVIMLCLSTPTSADPGDVHLSIDNVGGYLRELDGLAETVDHPDTYRRCFRHDLGDRATVTVNVRASGRPGAITFDGTPSRRLKACIQRVVRGLRFVRQVHPRSVTFTLTVERPHVVMQAYALVGDDASPLGLATAKGSTPDAAHSTGVPPATPPAVTVVDAVSVAGPDVADSATAKIRSAYLAGLKRCYRDAFGDTGGPTLEATLTFEVGVTGRAGSISWSGITSDSLAACLTGRAEGWRFSIPADPATVRLGLRFEGAVDDGMQPNAP